MSSKQPPFFVIPVRDTGIQVSIFYTHQISLLAKVSWIPVSSTGMTSFTM
ncbi:hypothetical protein H9I48_02545 [Wolbachia pipientis]|nr:hypothetical protein [Wolbachia pipientis]MBC6686116.1 hypothetical protein [Wolbachia pipientis]